jgi:hypothetical protein
MVERPSFIKSLNWKGLFLLAMFTLHFSIISSLIQINVFQGYNLLTTLFGIVINTSSFIFIISLLPEDLFLKKGGKKW